MLLSRPGLLSLALVASLPLRAQLVTPKTVPVFQDEQFSLYPTSRPGMSGVSIAINDTLGDPFANPAKATRLQGVIITASPYGHSIAANGGGGRTIPAGVMFGTSTWAGFVYGAFQEMDRAGFNLNTSDQTANNQYYSAAIARRFSDGLSVGLSAFHADLSDVDGVDLLYQGSDHITQSGSLSDFRLGATKEWQSGQVLEAVLLRSKTHMRHDVHFTTWTFNNVTHTSTQVQRTDVNLDQTEIFGAHTRYVMPVGTEGWHVGAMGTWNRLQHPKIPNYVLQNIPRDPGKTDAFNVGVGAGRDVGTMSFAAELVLEPMSSDTWADMTTDFARPDGSVIPAGQHTVENHFTFRNGRGGMSVGKKWVTDSAAGSAFMLNFGLGVNSISYELRQQNNMTRTVRNQHEHWVEAGPSLGFRWATRDMEFSYAYRAVCGPGECVSFGGDKVELTQVADVPSTGGIIAAPGSALRIQSGRESSHHFMVTVPVR